MKKHSGITRRVPSTQDETARTRTPSTLSSQTAAMMTVATPCGKPQVIVNGPTCSTPPHVWPGKNCACISEPITTPLIARTTDQPNQEPKAASGPATFVYRFHPSWANNPTPPGFSGNMLASSAKTNACRTAIRVDNPTSSMTAQAPRLPCHYPYDPTAPPRTTPPPP